MVRIHQAPATGRRWASEIEITGIDGKGREDHLALRQVEPAMERGDEWYRLTGKQRERIIIEMKVQQIKIMSPLANSLDHGHMQRIGVADRAVQTQCLRKTCLRLSRPHFAGEGCRSGDLDSQVLWGTAEDRS